MCALALPIANAVHAYAVKTKNNTLAATVDFSMADLIEGRDVASRRQLPEHLQYREHEPCESRQLRRDRRQADRIEQCHCRLQTAHQQTARHPRSGKTVTTSLQAEFAAADEDLTIMDDLLGQITDAKFASDFQNARIIVDTSASHASPTPPTPRADTASVN